MSNKLYTLPEEMGDYQSSGYVPPPTGAKGEVKDFYSLPSYLPEDPVKPISNITPVPEGSTIRTGVFKSPQYVPNRKGWQVDSDGNSEFDKIQIRNTFVTVPIGGDIQSAVNIMSAAGGGEVKLGSGTYYPTSDIILPSSVALVGVGPNSVIDFDGSAYQIKAVGVDTYSTGTVAINNDSSTLTGSGTTWTTAMAGRSILIGAYWYLISTVNSTTSITLDGVYLDPNTTGASYVIANPVYAVTVRDLLVQNSTSALFKLQYVNGATVDNVIFFNGAAGIDGDDSSFLALFTCSAIDCTEGFNFSNFHYGTWWNANVQNSTGNGFTANNISNWGMEIFCIINCGGDGMNLTNCHNNGIEDFTLASNTGQGIEFVSGNYDITLSDGWVGEGGSDGIKLTATSDRIDMVSMHLVNNTGYGINIAASTCDNNTLNVPTFSNNTAGTYVDNGTNTNIVDTIPSVNMSASENLTIGQPVGASNGIENNIARAVRAGYSTTHGITTPLLTEIHQQHIAPIGANKFVYLNHTVATSDTIFAQVGTVGDDHTVTLGTAVAVATATTPNGGKTYIVSKLDTDKFIVIYLADASATNIQYRVGTVSGTTITFGTAATLYTAASTVVTSEGFSADYISTDKFVFGFKTAVTADCRFMAGTTSGTVATAGTAVVFDTTQSRNNSPIILKKIATDKFAVLATFSGNAAALQICTLSGTTITQGTAVSNIISAVDTNVRSLEVISPTTDVLVISAISSTTGLHYTKAVTVSGTTPTGGTAITFTSNGASGTRRKLIIVSATKLLLIDGESNYNMTRLTLSGNTLTADATTQPYYVLSGSAGHPSIGTQLDNGGYIAADIVNDNTKFVAWILGMSTNFIGIIQKTILKNAAARLVVVGVDSNQSGLYPGEFYTVTAGTLVLASSSSSVSSYGTATNFVQAISSTQIKI